MKQNSVTFRARNLDASRQMKVYFPDDGVDLIEIAKIPSAAPKLATGLDEDEEKEYHLMEAMNTQFSNSNVIKMKSIPTPKFTLVSGLSNKKIKPPASYIKYDLFKVNNNIPDYDLNKSDVSWLESTFLSAKIDESELDTIDYFDVSQPKDDKSLVRLNQLKNWFESAIDRFEKIYDTFYIVESKNGQNGHIDEVSHHDNLIDSVVCTIKQEIVSITEDDNEIPRKPFHESSEFILKCLERWEFLRKNIKIPAGHLKPKVICEKEEKPNSVSDPYVAFRRRMERMLTRKNRKTDELSLEKMFRVVFQLQTCLFLMNKIAERERLKRHSQNLILQVLQQRYSLKDYSCRVIFRTVMSLFSSIQPQIPSNKHDLTFSNILLGTGLTSTLARIDQSHLKWQTYQDAQLEFDDNVSTLLSPRIEKSTTELDPNILHGFSRKFQPRTQSKFCRKINPLMFQSFDPFHETVISNKSVLHQTTKSFLLPSLVSVETANNQNDSPVFILFRNNVQRGGRRIELQSSVVRNDSFDCKRGNISQLHIHPPGNVKLVSCELFDGKKDCCGKGTQPCGPYCRIGFSILSSSSARPISPYSVEQENENLSKNHHIFSDALYEKKSAHFHDGSILRTNSANIEQSLGPTNGLVENLQISNNGIEGLKSYPDATNQKLVCARINGYNRLALKRSFENASDIMESDHNHNKQIINHKRIKISERDDFVDSFEDLTATEHENKMSEIEESSKTVVSINNCSLDT